MPSGFLYLFLQDNKRKYDYMEKVCKAQAELLYFISEENKINQLTFFTFKI